MAALGLVHIYFLERDCLSQRSPPDGVSQHQKISSPVLLSGVKRSRRQTISILYERSRVATRPTIPVLLPIIGSLLLPDNEQIIEFHLNHCTHFPEKSKHNKLINSKAAFERPLFYLKKAHDNSKNNSSVL